MNLARWNPAPAACLPAPLKAWLRHRGSLSLRLRALGGQFGVRVVFEGIAPLRRDEAALLGLPVGRKVRVREVVLSLDGVELVAARTFWAQPHLPAPWRQLARLGNRPLGEALFTDPSVQRLALQFRRESTVWGTGLARRSPFVRQRAVLVVSETFLPALQQRLCSKP